MNLGSILLESDYGAQLQLTASKETQNAHLGAADTLSNLSSSVKWFCHETNQVKVAVFHGLSVKGKDASYYRFAEEKIIATMKEKFNVDVTNIVRLSDNCCFG